MWTLRGLSGVSTTSSRLAALEQREGCCVSLVLAKEKSPHRPWRPSEQARRQPTGSIVHAGASIARGAAGSRSEMQPFEWTTSGMPLYFEMPVVWTMYSDCAAHTPP
mmetsp:Transcript_58756/g.166795  ORF Transcript_58756/g.166795 Transcript_58756/m.166795 type:complete len:107 (+) Transcript_58756:1368-1688(+)